MLRNINMTLGIVVAVIIVSSMYAGQHDRSASTDVLRSNQLFDAGLRQNSFLVDTNVTYVSARSNQGAVKIASDGTDFLMVWQDARSQYKEDIFCARVDENGIVLDSAGIHIATINYNTMQMFTVANPVIAYNGDVYLVVWQDLLHSPAYDIYGTRISASGVVLDTCAIPISTASSSQTNPAIVANGTDFLIVWEDERSGSADIYGARVDHNGLVLDPDGLPICSYVCNQAYPSVSFDGTNNLIVWQDNRNSGGNLNDIYGARMNPDGIVLDTNGIAISTNTEQQQFPSISCNDSDYLVVWEDDRNGTYPDIYGARVNTAGVVIDPDGFAISSVAYFPEMNPEVTFDGTNFLIVWEDDRNGTAPDIYGARVTPAGTVLDTFGIPISLTSGMKNRPSVAFNGADYLVAWADDRDDYPNDDIYGSRVSPNGAVLDPAGIKISTAAVFQTTPAIAFDGTNYLIAWTDYRLGLYMTDIMGTRVTPAGNILDSPAFVICNASFGQYSPSIGFDGLNYLAVWTHNIGGGWDVCGTRISQAGIVLDPSYIHFDTYGMNTQVAYGDPYFLVVWVDYRDSYTSPDIYGARVDEDGNVLDTAGIPVSVGDDSEYGCSVCFGNTNFLVVWQDKRNGMYYDLYCARVHTDGTVIDQNGIPVSTADSTQRNVSVAFDGNNYLVVWEDRRNGTIDIYGARVTAGGTVLDPDGIQITVAAGEQQSPSVAYDGTNFVVVWGDNRYNPYSKIYGAVINADGVVIDDFTISQNHDQYSPAIACGSENVCVAYSGWTETINVHPANTFRVWGAFPSYVGMEEEPEHNRNAVEPPLEIYPNPSHRYANIRYCVINDTHVVLSLYDATGRLVKTLLHERQNAGVYQRQCDMTDLAQGVYFVRLQINNRSTTGKIIIAR